LQVGIEGGDQPHLFFIRVGEVAGEQPLAPVIVLGQGAV
jgi:hypothetical protein